MAGDPLGIGQITRLLQEASQEQSRRRAAAVEKAVEVMLQRGHGGVFVDEKRCTAAWIAQGEFGVIISANDPMATQLFWPPIEQSNERMNERTNEGTDG